MPHATTRRRSGGGLLTGLLPGLLTGCVSYSPAPVDLRQHARAFAQRLAEDAISPFAEQLRRRAPTTAQFDAKDGVTLAEAQLIALLYHPDLRAARLRAGVAAKTAEHAGTWDDPALGTDFARILEDVDYPWLVSGMISLTVPLTGQPGLERRLASSRHGQMLVKARVAEASVLDELALAWVEWSAAVIRESQLAQLVANLHQLQDLATQLAEAGELTRPEARVFAIERLTHELEWSQQTVTRSEHLATLHRLLGLPPRTELQFVAQAYIDLRAPDPTTRDRQLADGPRLAVGHHDHAIAERRLELEVRRQWPELLLSGGHREEDGEPRAAFGFALTLPLWNRNAGPIAEAQAERELAAELLRGNYERALQDLAACELRHDAARARRQRIEDDLIPLVEKQIAESRQYSETGGLDLLLDALLRADAARAAALQAATAEAAATTALNRLFWPDLGTPISEELR